jgi:hypothetical protein
MLERSYVPMLGATINNISIDPAMQQHQQVANPQSATQHFNFSPGSYATFTAQHNSGNLHNSGNGAPHQSTYQPPIEDDLETGEEAYYTTMGDFGNFFDTPGGEGDSSSRVFAEKSAMGVNGSQNTFSYLGMPPQQPHEPAHDTTQPLSYQGQPSALMPGSPYPPPHYSSTRQQSSMSMVNGPLIPQSHEQQPMHYNIAHAPNVSTQHDASSYAACPRAFEHVPANGTSDRSGGNTQGNQESMPQTQPKPPGTKKRRISKVSGGRAASSSGTPKKKRATATKRKPLDYVPTNFGQGVYTGMSAEAAEERLEKMVWLNLDGPDDVEDVAAHREAWIRSIMSSFDRPYSATPVVEDFGDLLHRFKPWQDDQYSSAMKVIKEDKIGNLVEAVATSIYSKIISSHTLQILNHGGDTFHCDPTLKCSKRLSGCIEAIEKLAIIRQDVIKNLRIAELISNPAWIMRRSRRKR